MDDQEIARFIQTRSETAMWCQLEGQRSSFRTPALRPALEVWPTIREFDRALSALRQRRRDLLGERVIEPVPEGRLLLCQVNESISSGESEFETSGFFDVDDRPPWDTWVWQFESADSSAITLVSWVPYEWESLVGRGIEVNPYGCICWLTDQPIRLGSAEAVRTLVTAGMR